MHDAWILYSQLICTRIYITWAYVRRAACLWVHVYVRGFIYRCVSVPWEEILIAVECLCRVDQDWLSGKRCSVLRIHWDQRNVYLLVNTVKYTKYRNTDKRWFAHIEPQRNVYLTVGFLRSANPIQAKSSHRWLVLSITPPEKETPFQKTQIFSFDGN